MLFDTLAYWVFFALVLLATASLSPSRATGLLVAASYLFYAAWEPWFVLLLAGSTVANWSFGLWIDRSEDAARRRATAITVTANLATLAVFKYANLIADALASGVAFAPRHLELGILLPVGISFFTFEGIAYAVDVYRRDLPARRSLAEFALFIAFFPHLVSGPIIRPVDFFPQIGRPLCLDDADARWGLREILKGLFKKLVLSNFFAPIADACFQATSWHGAPVPVWGGVLAFSFQIYFDFSGYTDVARGCARLLGFRFPPNFERPYLSRDIAEFWRCWHISLSKWLRDYLYIPLGGNRRGEARTYVNLLIVMGLGGLWHGASWNFGLWGLYHGGLLIAHRFWRKGVVRAGLTEAVDHPALQPFWILCTFACVTIGWIPFRAPDMATTWRTVTALFTAPDATWLAEHPTFLLAPLLSMGFCAVDRERRVQDWAVERGGFAAVVALGVVVCLAIELLGQVDRAVPFVYFKF